MEPQIVPETSAGCDNDQDSGVRLLTLNLPEDEGEGLGFRLTRTLWDPYPWVREVSTGGRADNAGLKMGDCLLQADGRDLLGLPVGQVAGLIRGDGAGRGVSLLVWNCGVDPRDDPELLWSCGGGSRGEKSRRALAGVVRALACCVCASTATRALSCARSHLYCEACWSRVDRCALCREPLPAKESPYARNLVAEQVFEAIATEYEIKNVARRPVQTTSAYTTPNRSPNLSPASHRRGQYQLSAMNRKKVQFCDKYASDPNIHKTFKQERLPSTTYADRPGNSKICHCQNDSQVSAPKIQINDDNCPQIQHKLVTRLNHACSLVDLQNTPSNSTCPLSRSLNSLGEGQHASHQTSSLENLKKSYGLSCDAPILLVPAPPIYLVTCDHNTK